MDVSNVQYFPLKFINHLKQDVANICYQKTAALTLKPSECAS